MAARHLGMRLGFLGVVAGATACVGSTLPLPDMTKISFAHDPAANEMMVSGLEGAVASYSTVRLTNQRTDAVERVAAGAKGAFVVFLNDTLLGDTLSLVIERDGEEGSAQSLPLVQTGEPPRAPVDVEVRRPQPGEPAMELAGRFADETRPLRLRIANLDSGEVFEAETVPVELNNRGFEVPMRGLLGEMLAVYGINPGTPPTPGPLVRLEINR